MNIELAYGHSGITLEIPDDVTATVIRKTPLPVPDDPAAVIERALDNPVGAPPLVQNATGARTACILICDITRPVPNRLFLRPIIERLLSAGVPAAGITVLVATGLHRPNLDEELAELIGDPWVLEKVACVNHYARNDEDHVMFGSTARRGVPVGIDKRFVNADVRIATGLVEPHFMAGYSGGRKVVAPGVAHHSTIRTFHSARFMEDPLATSCNLDGNPLHDEQLDIVGMLGGTLYGLNTVIDESRNLIFANFGEIIESHAVAVSFVRQSIEVKVGRKFDVVVTSAAGYPLDRTYYQTVKGMVTPLDILADGGTLIIAAECGEGLGSQEFRKAQQRLVELGPDAFLSTLLKKELADVDEWQTEMQLKPMRVGRIILVASTLTEEDRRLTGVDCRDDLNETLRTVLRETGTRECAVVPEGPYVVPFHGTA